MSPQYRAEIIALLRDERQRLDTVIGMIEADMPCIQILHQINAVQEVLCSAKQALILEQSSRSVRALCGATCAEEFAAEVGRLTSLYRMVTGP